MVGGASGHLGHNSNEAQLLEVEHVNKGIDHAHWIALIDPVIQAVRQKRRLAAISPFNEPLHQSAPHIARPHIPDSTFSRSQGQTRKSSTEHNESASPPMSGHEADMRNRPLGATSRHSDAENSSARACCIS